MAHAVLLHPHFSEMGNQHNPVIEALYQRLQGTDITPHRFDFSTFQLNVAEEEAVAQVEACDGPVVLVGYSYGGLVASAITHPSVVGWVLIAPALIQPQFITPATPWHLPETPEIAADTRTKLVALAEYDAWFGPEVIDPLLSVWWNCEPVVVKGADHFFAGKIGEVTDLAAGWIERALQAIPTK